jgi:hypothetical protein
MTHNLTRIGVLEARIDAIEARIDVMAAERRHEAIKTRLQRLVEEHLTPGPPEAPGRPSSGEVAYDSRPA